MTQKAIHEMSMKGGELSISLPVNPFMLTIWLLLAFSFSFSPVIFGQGIDNLVIEHHSNSTIQNKKLIIDKSFVFQVNNKDGDWIGEVTIPFSKDRKVENLEGWITDQSGTVVRKLKKKDIEDRSAISNASLYRDDFYKYFELKHNSYPYQVHYRYRLVTDEFLFVNYWFPLLYKDTPTLYATLKVEVPEDYEMNILQDKCGEPNVVQKENTVVYSWEAKGVTAADSELFAPNMLENYPRVIIVPARFRYGVEGKANSWIQYGNWQCELKEGMTELPYRLKVKIASLLEGVEDPIEKIRILYHYLQDNTRYIYVKIDVGGQKPYPAMYVADNQYGDCKALSNFMQALLEEAGIASLYTIIYAGEDPKQVNEAFVGPQFNHVIVAVPVNQDTVWLETTSGISPFNYLGTFTQNRTALAVKKDSSAIVKTPALTADEVLEQRTSLMDFKTDLSCQMQIQETLRGPAFEEWNSIIAYYASDKQKRELTYRVPLKLFDLTDWDVEKKNRDAREVALRYDIVAQDYIKTYDDNIILPLLPLRIPKPERPGKRDHPVRIIHPINLYDSVLIQVRHYREFELPKDIRVETPFGNYSINTDFNGEQVIVVRKFLLNTGEYPLEKYEEFYRFFKEVRNIERRNSIIIKPITQ
jgi:hypothetical protein